MVVHLYTLAWNEADYLGFFFRHYDSWVDRYVVYDNGSTDETLEILHAHPKVDVRSFEWTDPDSFAKSHQEMQNHSWKESRGAADWIVVTAIDEHLHVPGVPMRDYLRQCRDQGVSLLHAMGFQMVSEEFPEADELLCESRTTGAPYGIMSKLSILAPSAIHEANFGIGRHKARPQGRVKLPRRDQLLLLHYKYIGFERAYQRHRFLESGLCSKDFKGQWSKKYAWSRERLRQDWDLFSRAAVDMSEESFNALRCHRNRRWWRRQWKIKQRLGLVSRRILTRPRESERWAA